MIASDIALFRHIAAGDLELTGSDDTTCVDKLKMYAIQLRRKSSKYFDLNDHVVVLKCVDAGNEIVIILNDYDVISALREYLQRMVLIQADVDVV